MGLNLSTDIVYRHFAYIFQDQGGAIDQVAKKTIKVLVVGNPANTNAAIWYNSINFIHLLHLDLLYGLKSTIRCGLSVNLL